MVERRALLALLCVTLALGVGCSGGGGSPSGPSATSVPTPVPSKGASATPPPTQAPTPIVTASPTPMPTAAPSAAALSNPARPLHNGDAYAYAGTTQQNFVYSSVAPTPVSTSAASTTFAVAQNVTVTSPATYGGVTNLADFTTTETDTSPLQTTKIKTDTFYGTASGGSGITDLLDYGYTSVDSLGQKFAVTTTNAQALQPTNGLIDVLPEISGSAWSNAGAQTIVQSEADGFAATRTYAGDGSYVENATYPQGGVATPTAAPLTSTITAHADGTATYNFPLFGPPNSTISYSAPNSQGVIAINTFVPGATPTSQPILNVNNFVSAWYQQPVKLYQELDRDNGAVAIPSACNVSAANYGTQANEIEQKSVRVDPVLGTIESFDELTYVTPTAGVVCVQLQDQTLTYYDYSGQGNGSPIGVAYSGGNSPLETATIATTIGLVSETVTTPFSLRRSSVAAQSGMRLANARSNFLALVEHRRISAQKRAFHYLRTSILERIRR